MCLDCQSNGQTTRHQVSLIYIYQNSSIFFSLRIPTDIHGRNDEPKSGKPKKLSDNVNKPP